MKLLNLFFISLLLVVSAQSQAKTCASFLKADHLEMEQVIAVEVFASAYLAAIPSDVVTRIKNGASVESITNDEKLEIVTLLAESLPEAVRWIDYDQWATLEYVGNSPRLQVVFKELKDSGIEYDFKINLYSQEMHFFLLENIDAILQNAANITRRGFYMDMWKLPKPYIIAPLSVLSYFLLTEESYIMGGVIGFWALKALKSVFVSSRDSKVPSIAYGYNFDIGRDARRQFLERVR